MSSGYARASWRRAGPSRPPAPPLFLLQPLLAHMARTVARRHPEIFVRLGPHQTSRFVIEPLDLPFMLYLQPKSPRPLLRALPRRAHPTCDARIAAPFIQLLRMIDGAADGDAAFFARDLVVSGNIEAVVSLRNAIDDIDGSLAATVAEMFGPLGRFALAALQRRARKFAA